MSNPVILCPHCGNKAPMKLLNKYEKVTNINYSEYHGEGEGQFYDIFEVFECPVCERFQLFHTDWDTEGYYEEDYDAYEHGSILYPVSEKLNLSPLPFLVKRAYESAWKVKNIDHTICAIALRRTLEMVCKDKGAVNGQLHHKLNELQQKGILPPLMGDISKVIKDFGNMAAHGDQVLIDKYTIQNMFRFINKILEYVYILPNEMSFLKEELELMTRITEKETS